MKQIKLTRKIKEAIQGDTKPADLVNNGLAPDIKTAQALIAQYRFASAKIGKYADKVEHQNGW
jgi:hypothetical protein